MVYKQGLPEKMNFNLALTENSVLEILMCRFGTLLSSFLRRETLVILFLR